MASTNPSDSKVSNFFLNIEEQINLANFLSYTAEEIEGIIRPLESIDLTTFDSLDEDEKEYYTGDLWCAVDITAYDIETLISECEQSVGDYRLLSEALLNWKEGGPNPLTNTSLMRYFHWVKSENCKGIIYELRHEAINHLLNYTLGDLFPYLGEEYFTQEALDYMNCA